MVAYRGHRSSELVSFNNKNMCEMAFIELYK